MKDYLGMALGGMLGAAGGYAVATQLPGASLPVGIITGGGALAGSIAGELLVLAQKRKTPAMRGTATAGDNKKNRPVTGNAAPARRNMHPMQPVFDKLRKSGEVSLDLDGQEMLRLAVQRASHLPIDIKALSGRLLASVRQMPAGRARDRLYDLAMNFRDEHPDFVQEGRVTPHGMRTLLGLMQGSKNIGGVLQRLHLLIHRGEGEHQPVHLIMGMSGKEGLEVNSVVQLGARGIQSAETRPGSAPFFTIPPNALKKDEP